MRSAAGTPGAPEVGRRGNVGPHDKAFRKLMKEEGVAEALLRERLPPSLVARFEGPPQHLSESFVDGAGKGHLADVVLGVKLTGGASALVLFVVEHKRTEGAFVLVQVLRYLTSLYEQLARAPGTGRLPVVVPLIIYNGDAPWSGPRRFSDLLEASVEVKRLSVDFEVVLLDVGTEPACSLSAHPTLKGGLLGLKAAATPRAGLGPVLGQMVGALADEESTLRFFLQYLMSVVGRDALPLVERAAQQQGQGKEKAMQTISEFLESKGYRRGKRQGLKEGLEQGLEKGLEKGLAAYRDGLRRVLLRRFKKVPAAIEHQVAEADAATLTRWLEAALEAKSLKAVFASH